MLFGDFVEAKSKDLGEAVEDRLAEDYGYSSDSDLEDEWDGTRVEHSAEEKPYLIEPSTVDGGGRIECENHEERARKGKVVKIPDVAFVT